MVRTGLTLAVALGLFAMNDRACAQSAQPNGPDGWHELAPIPDGLGLAGPYVGVAGNLLVVAGGANFREGIRPWNGGIKTWHDAIYVLDRPDGRWKTSQARLPRPLGYGVALSVPEGMLCIGGCDKDVHVREVFLIRRSGDDVEVAPGPSLPVPLAYSAGAVVGSRVVIAGGTESPTATRAERHMLLLDLDEPVSKRAWKTLAPMPGPSRFLAAAGSDGQNFFLFGGIDLRADAAGAPERIKPFHADAWRFHVGDATWTRLPDLPAPRAACPTPAPQVRHKFAIVAGDDGALTAALQDRHPGFPATTLLYDPVANRWETGPKFRNAAGMIREGNPTNACGLP